MGKHREWRKIAKKLRRKRIRQAIAEQRHCISERERLRRELSPTYQAEIAKQAVLDEIQEREEQRLAELKYQEWLKMDEEAQKRWQESQARIAKARDEKARQERLIREEWERERQLMKEKKEKLRLELEEKKKKHDEFVQQLEDFVNKDGVIPEELNTVFETNPEKPVCPFFKKTGACRFGNSCSRNHAKPGVSKVLVIPGFYSNFCMEQANSNEYDTDLILEYEDQETYSDFKEFFKDVLPEFQLCGKVRQFKVCCNFEQHLRGNVYIEYSTFKEAVRAYQTFSGRWYAGKQLRVEFTDISSWKSAICGLHNKKRCPKGRSCNFLHVFRNPDSIFYEADLDRHRTPPTDTSPTFTSLSHSRWSESPEPPENRSSEARFSSHRSENNRWENSGEGSYGEERNRREARQRYHYNENSTRYERDSARSSTSDRHRRDRSHDRVHRKSRSDDRRSRSNSRSRSEDRKTYSKSPSRSTSRRYRRRSRSKNRKKRSKRSRSKSQNTRKRTKDCRNNLGSDVVSQCSESVNSTRTRSESVDFKETIKYRKSDKKKSWLEKKHSYSENESNFVDLAIKEKENNESDRNRILD